MANTLRTLAQKARNRLRAICANNQNIENEEKYTEAYLSAKTQYAIIANQKRIEDDPLYNKVKKILTKDTDTLNPIAQIIDHDIYDNLDETQKEKYICKLSKRYANVKSHILKEIETSQSKEAV